MATPLEEYMQERRPTVTISKDEYDQLKQDSAKLYALVRAGVDNWDGYDAAIDCAIMLGKK